ncbi:hypothetical protein BCR44DRAFT_321513 [Catenaria anguillulae PL171]|uniref:Uncharacterized protein n=1 Tax=Catenaria anguillulae PL171 TaxID=765915 RepID=A0A1Y2HJ24_9FUNG|nr:hypothetical protein BCR44DRAFT_321513 [Catenaria anguillulae PL171]
MVRLVDVRRFGVKSAIQVVENKRFRPEFIAAARRSYVLPRYPVPNDILGACLPVCVVIHVRCLVAWPVECSRLVTSLPFIDYTRADSTMKRDTPSISCEAREDPAPVQLPFDLIDPILSFLTLHLHSCLTQLDIQDAGNLNHQSPTSSPTLAPIFAVGHLCSKRLLHLFHSRLLPLGSSKPPFSYWSAARANRLDRMAVLLSVYGGTNVEGNPSWHSSSDVSNVLGSLAVQRAVTVAFGKQFFHILGWLVVKHGAETVLRSLNTLSVNPSDSPLVEATHKGKLKSLEWWFALVQSLVQPSDLESANWHLSHVEFEDIEAAMNCNRVPIDCLRWWVQTYLPHHAAGKDKSDASQLMFNYTLFCIRSNQPERVAWWIDNDPHLFKLALELEALDSPNDLTPNEHALLAAVLGVRFAFVHGSYPEKCSFAYIVHSRHFRPRFKLELAHALVNRASQHLAAIPWWTHGSPDTWALRECALDQLAATVHSEADAFHALHLYAAGLLRAQEESEVAVDLASARGFADVCSQWVWIRGDKIKYSHVALEEAVANAKGRVVEFWLKSGLPLKWRGSILMWASVPGNPVWVEHVRALWIKYGVGIEGTVPWEEDDGSDDDDDGPDVD